MDRQFYVHILTNQRYGTLYVGVTNDLVRRVWEHRKAITREKRIKKWHRDWKVNLIQGMNPGWEDLYDAITA